MGDLRSAIAGVQARTTAPAGHYRSASKGKPVEIAKMADAHLTNAIGKLKRGGATMFNSAALVALDGERKRRGL